MIRYPATILASIALAALYIVAWGRVTGWTGRL